MKISIIVNPVSGTNSARNRAKRIVKELEEHFGITAQYTKYAGHAVELTKDAVNSGCEILVAVGGDGTVNEIASALIGTETALIIVGTGSGNGLARDLGMFGLSAKQVTQRIEKNTPYRIDSGVADGKAFFCTCGTGFDALIGHLFAQTKVRGFLTYIKLSLKAYFNYKPQTYTLKTDKGETTHEAFVLNIANNKQFGNNAYIAPMANLQDGLFTVTIIKPFKWYHVPYMAYSLFFKKMHTNKFVETFDCGDCTLVLPNSDTEPVEAPITDRTKSYLHIDGEPISQSNNNIEIRIQPGSLKVL